MTYDEFVKLCERGLAKKHGGNHILTAVVLYWHDGSDTRVAAADLALLSVNGDTIHLVAKDDGTEYVYHGVPYCLMFAPAPIEP